MQQQRFNLHTHTARCGHAVGLDLQYVNSAIDAGFELLGFSDHIPYPEIRMPNDRMLYAQKDEYLDSIVRLKGEYANRIELKVGFEIEYFEDQLDYLMRMKECCDYMILGQHCKYLEYEYDCYCSDADVLEYVRQIESAVEKNLITYIAHPDYYMLGRRFFSEVCLEAAHRIAKTSAQYRIPLEINLNGFQYGKKSYRFHDRPGICEERYPYPFREFWEIASHYGCEVLYGYDAHSPIALLEKDREQRAGELLNGIPLNFVNNIILR